MMSEGEELLLTCQAVCKPSAISFNWLFNDKRINLQNKGRFIIIDSIILSVNSMSSFSNRDSLPTSHCHCFIKKQ